MESILDCFKKIAENENISITALESRIGASKGVLSKAVLNNTDIQCKWLLKLIEAFPHYNPEWLLTGKGVMTREQISQNSRLQEIQELNIEDQKNLYRIIDLFIKDSKNKESQK